MKHLILVMSFCLPLMILQAQENAIQVTKRNEESIVIKEKRRIRIKINHPKQNRLKAITGRFRFSKNKDSILIKNYTIAINDIRKIKRHPLAMSIPIGLTGIAAAYLTSFLSIFSSVLSRGAPRTVIPSIIANTIVLPSVFYQLFINGLNPLKGYNTKDGYNIEAITISNALVEK